jgi:toxin secretion/phage lysis holin
MIKIFFAPMLKLFKGAVIHDNVSTYVGVGVSFLGTTVSYFVGGFDYAMSLLVLFVCLDYVSGFLSAIKRKQLSSDVMYWGMIRKIFQFIIVGVGVALDRLLGNDPLIIRLFVVYYYIGMEGISLLENMVLLGIKVPNKLVEILEQVKQEETSNREVRDEVNKNLSDFSIKKKIKKHNSRIDEEE